MQNKQRIEILGVLEIISVLLICIMHYSRFVVRYGLAYSYPLQGNFVMDNIVGYADLLVELLFMISGFLIAYNYFEIIDKIEFKEYIKKRFIRLYPLFLMSTMLIMLSEVIHKLVTGQIFFEASNYTLYNFIMNLLFMQRGWLNGESLGFNGISWYISVLFFCYIIWYAIAKISGKFKGGSITYLVILTFLAVAALIVIPVNSNLGIFNPSMARGFSCFMIGCILCRINDRLSHNSKIKIVLLAWILAIWYCAFAVLIDFNLKECFMGKFPFCLMLGVYPLLIMSLANLPQKFIQIFNVTNKITRYNYSLYLMHIIVLICLHSADMFLGLGLQYNNIQVMLIYLVCCIVFAVFSYHVIEKCLIPLILNKFALLKNK